MIKHEEAREQYQDAVEADRVNRAEALHDLKFRAGEQWPDAERQAREATGRPALVINRCGQFIRRVTGAARQNPPSIKVIPTDDNGDPDQLKEMAEVREGLIRHIEHRSKAQSVYITALENAATCGVGHVRILTEYDDRDPFRQEIRIASVSDPLSVVYDPDARKLCKDDGQFAFVTGTMTKKAFKRRYPKAKPDEWSQADMARVASYWETGDMVRVAEYFRKAPEKRKLMLMSDGARVDITGMKRPDLELLVMRAAEVGIEPLREKEYETHKIFRSVLSGFDYLEDEVEFPSRYIPLIPVVGEEIAIGEDRVRHGLVRFMRDSQRLYNYWRTSAAEMVALAPKAPFMATAAQVGPFRQMWEDANRSPRPFLLYQPDPEAPGVPQRATAPEPPNAMWTEASIASEDMKGVTGIYDANLGAQGNETSGKAILARQREGDIGTFVYVDNLRHAVERVGVTLLDMLPRVYDTERTVQVLEEDGSTKPFTVNQTMPDGTERNSLSTGVYDVRVATGPTFQNKKEETAEAMLQLVQAFPALMQLAGDILITNLDFPRADEVAERLQQAMAGPQQPDPTVEARAQKDAAQAAKAGAEAESVNLQNLVNRAALGI